MKKITLIIAALTAMFYINTNAQSSAKMTINLNGGKPPVTYNLSEIDSITFTPCSDNTSEPILVYNSLINNKYQIYSANIEGSNQKTLTNDQFNNLGPKISPNRDKIAFISDRTGQWQVFTMNIDGSNVSQVTTDGTSNGWGSGGTCDWASESTIIYPNGTGLYKIHSDGTNNIQIATASSWSFDKVTCSSISNKIAVCTVEAGWGYNVNMYIFDTDGTNMSLLVANTVGAEDLNSFTPDGNKIAYFYDMSGHEESAGQKLNSHIFLINPDGTGSTDVSINKPDGTNDFHNTFTPDGSKIIFINGNTSTGGSDGELWIMNIDGSNRTKISTINADFPNCR